MQVASLGFRTDLALRALEGAEITDRGDYTVVRSPDNPTFWWGNFLLLAGWPEPGPGGGGLAGFAAEFPQAEHLALGVDAGHEPAQVPPEFLAAGLEFERATVLSCAAVQPPPPARRRARTPKPRSGGWNPTTTGSSLATWASAATATAVPTWTGGPAP